ncbi:hypothetical protein LCGC14_1722790 [marine sediment metagenome]|uniref:Uncharacterized protein n=1 Tax=marine sediment metagenome TaxID=412755 RepID=A0A0F9JSE4_9ZZZZ
MKFSNEEIQREIARGNRMIVLASILNSLAILIHILKQY